VLPRRGGDAEGFRLSPAEWSWVGAAVLGWGLASIALGKDTGWDFRNYHWYDAYALLNARLGFDVAVAHQATYFNPLLHVPFYLLAGHVGPAAAVFYTGATEGLIFLPLYLLVRAALAGPAPSRPGEAHLLTLAGMTGSTVVSMIGKTSYDQSVLSVLVLGGLAVLITGREALREASRHGFAVAALSGVLVGMAVGLKLTEAPFAIGLGVALAVGQGSLAARGLRLAAGALGGLAGVLATGGYWFLTLFRATGNPVFPFFNDVLKSSLIASGSYRDERFIPEGWRETLSFPFRFLLDYRVADDAPFHDLRIPLVYALLPLAALLVALRRAAREPLLQPSATLLLFAFMAASYVAWIDQFAVYRYLVLLEILAPLAIAGAVGLLPVAKAARWAIIVALLGIAFVTGRYEPGPHAKLDAPYVQLPNLPIPHPKTTMILMTGEEPLAYLIPSLPPEIPVLRIDGLIAGPFDGSRMTAAMRARVQAHRGDLFLIASDDHAMVDEEKAAREAIAAYDLKIVASTCRRFTTNLGGPYRFCPLIAAGPPHPEPSS
jgi:hypothetical protein